MSDFKKFSANLQVFTPLDLQISDEVKDKRKIVPLTKFFLARRKLATQMRKVLETSVLQDSERKDE